MKKFENKIDKKALTEAITNWIFHNDGYEGAIGGVLEEIPWTEEMGFDFWGDFVHDRIDEAIGSSLNGCEEWKLTKILNFSDCSEETIEYRYSFQKFVEDKVDHIYEVYQKSIDALNESLEKKSTEKKYRWHLINEMGKEDSDKLFNTHEECYEDMRKAVNDKVLWNIEYYDVIDCKVDIHITATKNEIVCTSYSGTYTWYITEEK